MLPTRSVQVLRKQRGPVVGVLNPFFPGLVQRVGVSSPPPVGQSGGWSVQVLLPPDTVQRLGADPSRLLDTRPLIGVDRSCQRAKGLERLIPLRSQPRLWSLRVPLAVPQPEPKPGRGKAVLVNVNNHSVKEVINRNKTASRRLPSSGYICGAADALRPTFTLPLEQIASSGTLYHAAERLPNQGRHRRCLHLPRPVVIDPDRTASDAARLPLARPAACPRAFAQSPPASFRQIQPWPYCACASALSSDAGPGRDAPSARAGLTRRTPPWAHCVSRRVARTGNGAISNMVPRMAGAGPSASVVAGVGNRAGNQQNVSDSCDDYQHKNIQEVIHSNNDHREFPAVQGRLKQPLNRR